MKTLDERLEIAASGLVIHGMSPMAIDEAKAEIKRLRKALEVFAEPGSWMKNFVDRDMLIWNKMGDYFDPREFARLALEGENACTDPT